MLTPPPPLRHLVYTVSVDAQSHTRTKSVVDDTALAPDIAHGTRDRVKGTITLDVIEASADGGLVLRISELAQDRRNGPITVGTAVDGSLVLTQSAADSLLPKKKASRG